MSTLSSEKAINDENIHRAALLSELNEVKNFFIKNIFFFRFFLVCWVVLVMTMSFEIFSW